MSGLTFNILSIATVITAFTIALTGSIHCIGMCGPLRLIANNSPKASLSYQLGRGSIYLLLGALAGKIGSLLPPLILIIFLPFVIVVYFFRKNKKPILQKLRFYLLRKGKENSFLLGFFSGLLPCGFLHGWVIIAGSTASLSMGLLFMFIFWIATLPALELSVRIARAPLLRIYQRFPKFSLVVFFMMIMLPVGLRASMYFHEKKHSISQELTCH
ncbi:MAG: sulfite exporter TauE/SafE family protein [Oligoflexia bacterium]|nr:sulfite exporter TauE/SafE family protein [Oligoflexia bacterium]